MNSSEKYFIIPFVGLQLGTHEFEFEVDDSFFNLMEFSIIEKGKVKVTLQLEKKETMMNAQYTATGIVETLCDRCDTPMELPVEGTFSVVYKFGLEESEDEALIVLHPESFELDVRDAIYELVTILLPPRVVHPSGECDEEMVALIQQYIINPEDDEDEDDWDDEEEEQIPGIEEFDPKDPRWGILKNLN